jgi:hypothetical protein
MEYRVEGRAIRFAYDDDSLWDQSVSMFSAATNVIAVQFGRHRGRNAASPFQHLQTVFLAVGDGRVLGSQLGLPMVLGRSADHLFAIADRMADTIDIYSFRFSDR